MQVNGLSDTVTVVEHAWGSGVEVLTQGAPLDLVVACDVMYLDDTATMQALVKVRRCLAQNRLWTSENMAWLLRWSCASRTHADAGGVLRRKHRVPSGAWAERPRPGHV